VSGLPESAHWGHSKKRLPPPWGRSLFKRRENRPDGKRRAKNNGSGWGTAGWNDHRGRGGSDQGLCQRHQSGWGLSVGDHLSPHRDKGRIDLKSSSELQFDFSLKAVGTVSRVDPPEDGKYGFAVTFEQILESGGKPD
jgi:hypothetical protein